MLKYSKIGTSLLCLLFTFSVGSIDRIVQPKCLACEPADFPLDAAITDLVEAAISEGQTSGAVVLVADRSGILYEKAFGYRLQSDEAEVMTVDTVFDLASITKPVATATAVMHLFQEGKVDLDQPVSNYLPEFTGHGKESILVSELLLHTGGLIPDNSLKDYQQGTQVAWEKICNLKMTANRGERFMYSDVGFIVLGKLVEKVSGLNLNQFTRQKIYAPLGMNETGFLPAAELKRRAAATEKREGQWMRGEVHDPRAYLMDGIAGHAGLFSTARDLATFGQSMLYRGEKHPMVLNPATFEVMTKPRETPRGTRTYGWDHRSPYSSNRGSNLSDEAFGHGGFTGTVLWIDPTKDRVFVFLSSRLHPDGKGSVNTLAGQIASLIGQNSPNQE